MRSNQIINQLGLGNFYDYSHKKYSVRMDHTTMVGVFVWYMNSRKIIQCVSDTLRLDTSTTQLCELKLTLDTINSKLTTHVVISFLRFLWTFDTNSMPVHAPGNNNKQYIFCCLAIASDSIVLRQKWPMIGNGIRKENDYYV